MALLPSNNQPNNQPVDSKGISSKLKAALAQASMMLGSGFDFGSGKLPKAEAKYYLSQVHSIGVSHDFYHAHSGLIENELGHKKYYHQVISFVEENLEKSILEEIKFANQQINSLEGFSSYIISSAHEKPSVYIDQSSLSQSIVNKQAQYQGVIDAAEKSEAFTAAYSAGQLFVDFSSDIYITRAFALIAKHPSSIANNLLTMFARGVEGGLVKSRAELTLHLTEIASQVLIDAYLRTNSETARAEIRQDYVHLSAADNLHYSLNDPRAIKAFGEVLRIQRRARALRHGSSVLMFNSRRNPRLDHWLLAQYGADTATKVSYIDAKDKNEMPGRGVKIAGLNLEKLFVPNLEAKKLGKDPHVDYKAAWPEVAPDFDKLPLTDFVFTRGAWIASAPEDDSHTLQITKDGKTAHYSMVIFSDHFGGKTPKHVGSESVYLVPTEILEDILDGTEIAYEDFRGFGKGDADVNQNGLNIPGNWYPLSHFY